MGEAPDLAFLKQMGLIIPRVAEEDVLFANITFDKWLENCKTESLSNGTSGIAIYNCYGCAYNNASYITTIGSETKTKIQVHIVNASSEFVGSVPTFSCLIVLRAILIKVKTVVDKYRELLEHKGNKTYYPRQNETTRFDYTNTYLFLGWTGAFSLPVSPALEDVIDTIVSPFVETSADVFRKRIINVICPKSERKDATWNESYAQKMTLKATHIVKRSKVPTSDKDLLWYRLNNISKFKKIGVFPFNKNELFDTGLVMIIMHYLFPNSMQKSYLLARFMSFYKTLDDVRYHAFITHLTYDLGAVGDTCLAAVRKREYNRCGLSLFGTQTPRFNPFVEFLEKSFPSRFETKFDTIPAKHSEEFKDTILRISGVNFSGLKGCADFRSTNAETGCSSLVYRPPGVSHSFKWLESVYFANHENVFSIEKSNDVFGRLSELSSLFPAGKKVLFIVPSVGFLHHPSEAISNIRNNAWHVKLIDDVLNDMKLGFEFSDTHVIFLWSQLLQLGDFVEIASAYPGQVFKSVLFVGAPSFLRSGPCFVPFINNLCERFPEKVIATNTQNPGPVCNLRDLANADAFEIKTMKDMVTMLKGIPSTSVSLKFHPSARHAADAILGIPGHMSFATGYEPAEYPDAAHGAVNLWSTTLGYVFPASTIGGEDKIPICWCDYNCPATRRMKCGKLFVFTSWFEDIPGRCFYHAESISALTLGLHPMTPGAVPRLFLPDQYYGAPVNEVSIIVVEGGTLHAIVEAARHCISQLTIYFPFLEHDEIGNFHVSTTTHPTYPILKVFGPHKRLLEDVDENSKRQAV